MGKQERVVDVETVQRARSRRRRIRTSSPSCASLLRFHRWSRRFVRSASAFRRRWTGLVSMPRGLDRMGNIVGRMGDGPRVILSIATSTPLASGIPGSGNGIHLRVRSRTAFLRARRQRREGQHAGDGLWAGDCAGAGPGHVRRACRLQQMKEEWCDGIAPRALVEDEGTPS